MNTEQIKNKLNENRKKLLLKDTQPSFNILSTLRVADKGSSHFNEKIAIIERMGSYYLKEYTGGLPSSIAGCLRLSKKEATIVISVIEDYKQHKHYHVNPYTWLICGCLYKGFDLINEGLLDI
jgi:hypothetical protein